jgi:phage terminase large subunit-like protein
MPKKRIDTPPPHVQGAPPRPKALTRACYNAWNRLVVELAGKLYQDDGPRLLEFIQARADWYKGTGERRESGRRRAAEIQEFFDKRQPPPIPAPAPPTPQNGESPESGEDAENGKLPDANLETFLADVKAERHTFAQRLQPGATVVLENSGQVFAWPSGHAASVGRDYCQQITQGSAPACELLRRACARHLSDLERGHERGLFFDPVAAANIATWYRDFIGLKLEPWETWIVTSLFAWKRASGLRRFSEAWISVGKKNGKTAVASGVGLFGLVADQEKFAAVYSASTKKDQAKIAYGDAVRAVKSCPALLDYVRIFKTGKLAIEETDSWFEPLSSDVKSMEGLRPSTIVCDEIHVWQDRTQWDTLTKGVVSRAQPLIFSITTAGENKNTFAGSKYALAEKILNGVFEEDSTFVAIYELDATDDPFDEKNWPKSNPNLGISLQASALRKIAAEAQEDPSGRAAFMRYHANMWVSFRQGRSIPSDKFDACRCAESMKDIAPMDLRKAFLEENATAPCWAGIDLGEISDLSALTLLWPRCTLGGEEFEVLTAIPYFWMPEAGLLDKERQWGVPLSQWVREGWVKLIEGDLADPRVIKADVIKLLADGPGKVQSIGFDPWQARVMASEIGEETHVECMAVPQKPSELTTPCKELKNAIFCKKFWHLGNPVLRWMAGNLVIEPDGDSGGIRPKKLNPNEKIDGFQAMITAWSRLLAAPTSLGTISNQLNARWGGNNPKGFTLLD